MKVLTGKGCIVDVTTGLVFGGVQEITLQDELETWNFPAGDRWSSYSVPIGVNWRGEITFKALDLEIFKAVLGSESLESFVQTPGNIPKRFSFYGVLKRSGDRIAVYLADCKRAGEPKVEAPVGGIGRFTISFVAQNNQAGDVVFYLPPQSEEGR